MSADLGPETGWKEVRPFPFNAAKRTFTAEEGGDRLAVRYFEKPDGALAAKVWFGPGSEGAPGHVHGGGLLTVLDEAMGAAAWRAGHEVMTVRLNAQFRRQVPVRTTLTVETKLLKVRGRVVEVSGRLSDPSGQACMEGEGTFLRLTAAQLKGIFGREDSK